jgi:hypothetical protein
MTNKFVWNEENVTVLTGAVGIITKTPVEYSKVEGVAEKLGTTVRSVAGKLRSLGYPVAKKPASAPRFSEAETKALQDFVNKNKGKFTAEEVSAKVFNNKFTVREIRGKLLSLKLSDGIKPAVAKEYVSDFSEAQTATILSMATSGAFIEEISDKVGFGINKVRGKLLSLLKKGLIPSLPKQKESHATASTVDVFESITTETFTVAELAQKTNKTERGIKTILTRRGLKAKDYDGAKRAAKIDEKKAA